MTKQVEAGGMRPGFLRREDAARYLGISKRTLAQWQASRLVPFIKVSHRVCLFKLVDLEKALDKLTVRAAGG